MKGTHHRIVAAAAWPALASLTHVPHWQAVVGILPAVAFSAGVSSPDVDNTRLWKRLDRWIPDELLGAGGPLGHRELIHWWGLPALLAFFLWKADLGAAEFVLWAACVGWGSHVVADAGFGMGGYSIREGVPVFPWGQTRIGLGFRSDGIASAICIGPVCAVGWWFALGAPGAARLTALWAG